MMRVSQQFRDDFDFVMAAEQRTPEQIAEFRQEVRDEWEKFGADLREFYADEARKYGKDACA